MECEKLYSIVEFDSDGSIAIVLKSWIKFDGEGILKTLFPPLKSYNRALKIGFIDQCWPLYNISVLKSNIGK